MFIFNDFARLLQFSITKGQKNDDDMVIADEILYLLE